MLKKPFKVAAWSFIILATTGIVSNLIVGGYSGILPINYNSVGMTTYILIFYSLIGLILSILIFYSFILLGRKFRNQFLIRMSWLGILVAILYSLYLLFGGLILNVSDLPTENAINTNSTENISSWPTFFILAYLIISIVVGVPSILLGLALLKISKKIKYARAAGILDIITGATMIIFVGYIIWYAAAIMEILLLFEASRRFEDNRKK